MKQIKEKKQRKGKKKINKSIPSIAKVQAGSQKANARRIVRGNEELPNSSKIGAGTMTARRNLSALTVHRRNHRTSQMISITS